MKLLSLQICFFHFLISNPIIMNLKRDINPRIDQCYQTRC